jgi:hypothetical protein
MSDPRIGPGILCTADTDGPTAIDDYVTVIVGDNASHVALARTISYSSFLIRGFTNVFFHLGAVDHILTGGSPLVGGGRSQFQSPPWMADRLTPCSINCTIQHANGTVLARGFRDNLIWIPEGDQISLATAFSGVGDSALLAEIHAAVIKRFVTQ